MKQLRKFRLLKPLISVGDVLGEINLVKREFFETQYEIIIGVSDDHAFCIDVPESIVLENPDYFEEIR